MVIELSGVQFGLKSYVWFQNWTSADFRPKLHDMTFNCHFIGSILKSHNFWRKTILQQSFCNSSCKILHTMTFCLSFSWNFIGYFKQTLESDWLFCFSVLFSLAWLRKRCDLEQKMARFVNKSHHWEPIRLQG